MNQLDFLKFYNEAEALQSFMSTDIDPFFIELLEKNAREMVMRKETTPDIPEQVLIESEAQTPPQSPSISKPGTEELAKPSIKQADFPIMPRNLSEVQRSVLTTAPSTAAMAGGFYDSSEEEDNEFDNFDTDDEFMSDKDDEDDEDF